MHDIGQIEHIYFLGIGGIGMSALARYFHTRGVHVAGYDKTPSPITRALEEEGIGVAYEDDVALLTQDPQLVVYTPAVPKSIRLFRHLDALGIPLRKRAEVLGMISRNIPTIAIAGTHGKTTVSAMLTHILKVAGIPCTAFLGGISTNYNTNYLGEASPQWLVAEADEYDRSFHHLSPRMALITAIDADHLDVYGSYEKLLDSFSGFARLISPGGTLTAKKGIAGRIGFEGTLVEYHPAEDADYCLSKARVSQGAYHAAIGGRLRTGEIRLGHPGRHNLENALAAAAMAHQIGVNAPYIEKALESFLGVKRRFEICLRTEKTVYIDDYAHHPEEIRACIASVRELWPGRKLTGIFQPHLYSRTRDLADQFAESLSMLDALILLDIYPARELPIEGVSAEMLLERVRLKEARLCKREELLDVVKNEDHQVLLTMGAGDIDRFAAPIAEILKNKALS